MKAVIYEPIPFDETYILYDPNDPFSFLCVIFSLLPIGLLIFYFSWFITSREMEPVFLAAGQVCNNIINYILKRIVKHDRPSNLYRYVQYPKLANDYGMPSAHSQFMGFFATFVFLRILFQFKNIESTSLKLFYGAALYGAAFMTGVSRIYLLYHEVDQVVIGIFVGCVLGAAYFIAVSLARDIGLVFWFLRLPFVECWYIKDSYDCALSFEEDYKLYLERKANATNAEQATKKDD